ncbi:17417_t:CDS:2 [Funneliformis caledonium]|uniref:17417_t:CDS:1 n=1 Tax=Funneliformis caledonium TaxID=1117310 RepID=A0A9N8ZTV9_9GLOM|nr:17417_t:CDS:2 [Funneliformis caledonium]
MSKNFSLYIVSWVLIIQLSVGVNCQMLQRSLHTTTLVDNKLYIIGGVHDLNGGVIGNQFLYLDVSVPFNTDKLSWNDITSTNIVPAHSAAASGTSNGALILYGGNVFAEKTKMDLIYMFNALNNTWMNVPKLNDEKLRKSDLKGISVNDRIYLFGGMYNKTLTNSMVIFDPVNLGFTTGILINAPAPRMRHGATLLPNRQIAYFGGMDDFGVKFPLNEIHFYDTMSDSWSKKDATGRVPSGRDAFSSVLGLDGKRLIIFGGFQMAPADALHVLDLTNMLWTVPNITGKLPMSRYHHQANVVGRFMVISFGKDYDQTIDNDVLLLDISNNDNYVWTNSFDTQLPNPLSLKGKPSSTTNKSILISASVVSIIIFGFLVLTGVFLYKSHKKKQNRAKILRVPGLDTSNKKEEILEIPGNVLNNRDFMFHVM